MFNTLQRRAARPVCSTRAPRLAGLAWLLALATWLSACGPGVGGTGTGETNGLSYFGATAASVCSADVGGVLGCVPGSGAASPAPAPTPSVAPVFLADAATGPRVQARVQDSAIDLSVICTGLRFRGQWGQVPGQSPRFFGAIGPEGAQAPATLHMQLSGAGVVVTVRDAADAVLLGPIFLLPVPMAGAPGGCG